MPLSQLIYTSTCTREMTPRVSHEVAYQSTVLRQTLNLTGRVFANDRQALGIIEGETSIVEHLNQPIMAREFDDYSVWLNSSQRYDYGPQIKHLTPENIDTALPENLSASVRIMLDAHLKPDLLAA